LGSKILLCSFCVALLACENASSSPEQRCAELRDACLCSEPLDNGDVYAAFQNPSDSTEKECGPMDATHGGIGTSKLPVPFPAGASARHAFKIESDGGSNGKLIHRLPADPFDITGKTLCVRHYALYGKDHDPPGNIKIARIGHPKGMAWQSAWSGGFDPNVIGSPSVSVVGDPGSTGHPVDCNLPVFGDASKLVEFDDCQDAWCRFEICAEHDPQTGRHLVRAQWVQVGGTHRHEVRGNCGAVPTPTSRVFGGEAYVLEYTTTAPPASNGGSRYLSHAMLVVHPYDPDFWIGPACEIEGGCNR
jgi:hypothetical protein